MPTYQDIINALLKQQQEEESVIPNSGNSYYDGLAKLGNALGFTKTQYTYPDYDTFISNPVKYEPTWNTMSVADQNNFIKNTFNPVNTGTDTTYSQPTTTTTTFKNGGMGNALTTAAQVGLAIVDRFQAEKARKTAQDQFNKQLAFATANAENQWRTNKNRTLSAINIGSALRNLTPAQAQARTDTAKTMLPKNFSN